MSYRCGVRGFSKFGLPDNDPHFVCDNCGAVHGVARRSGLPYVWFLDGKPPPKWTGKRNEDGTRTDYCNTCRDVFGCEVTT